MKMEKLNEEKIKAILQLKFPTSSKKLISILRARQYIAKNIPEHSEKLTEWDNYSESKGNEKAPKKKDVFKLKNENGNRITMSLTLCYRPREHSNIQRK